jgi:hypothetical protein
VGLVHANVTTFNKALTSLAQEVGWTIEYAALREAALMCRDAIVFTPPFKAGGGGGETKQAELVGRRAVERDINTLFVAQNDKAKVAGAMMLNNLASAAKRRNFGDFTTAKKQAQERSINFDAVIPKQIVPEGPELLQPVQRPPGQRARDRPTSHPQPLQATDPPREDED